MATLAPLLIGFFSGLRTFTAPAVIAWAVHLGHLKIFPPLSMIGSVPGVVILSLLALGEFIFDKLPKAPKRTDPTGVIARIFSGGVTGAFVSLGMGYTAVAGLLLGAVGAVAGCYIGYYTRKKIGQSLPIRDAYLGVLEDLITIGGSALIVFKF